MPFARPALAAALIATAPPASAQDSSRPTLWDVFTPENIAVSLVHSALTWARLLADIRYDQVSVDPLAMKATLTGVTIVPFIEGIPDGLCQISVERATINGAPLDRLADRRFRIALDGAVMNSGCLPIQAAGMLRGLGFPSLRASRVEADIDYDYASGGMALRVDADFDRVAALTLSADFDYVSYRMDFTKEEPMVAFDLTSAQLSVQDLGAWEIAGNFLPPDMKAPGALGPVVEAGLLAAFADGNGLDVPASEKQAAFAAAAGEVAAGFAAGPRHVVLSTRIERPPLRLSERSIDGFRPLFDALNPAIGRSVPAAQAALPVEMLDAAIGSETLPENAFEIGRALITGIGAPHNPSTGLRLLAPQARDGNAEASLLIANEIAESNPADAYAHALRAAAAGLPGALALLDATERELSFQQVLDAQGQLMEGPEEVLFGDLPGMRAAARDFLTGTNRPRSWQAAYYWASMAAAAGDATGVALRDELDDMMRLRGDADAWADESASLDNGVLRDWIAKDVPARLR